MSCNEWREYKLSELMEIINGGTPKTSKEEYWNGEIPWITVKDFNSNNKKVYKTEKSITLLGLQNSSTKLLNKGDLIISARGTVGALAMLGKPMAFNQSCYGLRANNLTTNDFLYYLLKHRLKYIKQNTHGSVFETITRNTFDILKIILPPLNEQKAIAKILSDLDEKIEINNRINKVLEEIAQTIFKRWFVDFEFPNENGEPYKSSGGEMVESELGPIPKGWELVRLGDLIIKNYKKFIDKDMWKNIKIIHLSVMPQFSMCINNFSKGIDFDSNMYELDELDILFGSIRPYFGKAGFSPIDGGVTGTVFSFKTKNSIDYSYVLMVITSKGFIEYAISMSQGTKMPVLKFSDLEKYLLPYNTDIVSLFNKMIFNFILEIRNRIHENLIISSVRDILLPKLMSGEIRVDLNNGQIVMKNNED